MADSLSPCRKSQIFSQPFLQHFRASQIPRRYQESGKPAPCHSQTSRQQIPNCFNFPKQITIPCHSILYSLRQSHSQPRPFLHHFNLDQIHSALTSHRFLNVILDIKALAQPQVFRQTLSPLAIPRSFPNTSRCPSQSILFHCNPTISSTNTPIFTQAFIPFSAPFSISVGFNLLPQG